MVSPHTLRLDVREEIAEFRVEKAEIQKSENLFYMKFSIVSLTYMKYAQKIGKA